MRDMSASGVGGRSLTSSRVYGRRTETNRDEHRLVSTVRTGINGSAVGSGHPAPSLRCFHLLKSHRQRSVKNDDPAPVPTECNTISQSSRQFEILFNISCLTYRQDSGIVALRRTSCAGRFWCLHVRVKHSNELQDNR